MPRYYCDYCDTYLTHDSPSVRKQHNAGYKHKANVRSYYQQFEEQQTQSFIDQRIKEHLGQTAAFQQVGAAYNQHLASFPGNPPRPRLPILPTPVMPMSGAVPSQPVPGIRLPVLPRPSAPAYGSVPMMAPNVGPPGAPLMSSMQENGLPRPPMINMPTAPSAGSGAPNSNEPLPTFTQAMYQTNPSAPGSTAPSATTSVETFSYAQQSEDGH